MRGRVPVLAATAAGLILLSAGPALAAEPLAQAEAEAVSLSIGGQSVSNEVGGPYSVRRAESGETASGANQPQASLLTNQDDRAVIGTLAQDATTGLRGDRGTSAACAGVAGQGATFVGVGDGGSCLTPGEVGQLQLTADGLDLDELGDIQIMSDTPGLGDLLGQLPGGAGPLEELLDQALAPFGNAGLVVELGAVTSQCTAGPGNVATGSAQLTDLGAFLQLPEDVPDGVPQRITLLDFPTNPAPNTRVATDLDEVVDLVVGAVVDSLQESDLPQQLTAPLEQVREAVRENLTSALADQLGPLEDNLLEGTLNEQVRRTGAIEVTAVDLKVLPVAAEQAGFVPVDAQLARSACGPGGRATDAPPPADPPEQPREPSRPDRPTPASNPEVPRSVPAGAESLPGDGVPPLLALAALTVVATATGIVVHQRAARSADGSP